MSKYYTYGYTS